jgi:hypothetical protein
MTFINNSNHDDTRRVAVPNSGNVSFSISGTIFPGGAGFLSQIGTIGATFDQLGKSTTVRLKWPTSLSQFCPLCGELRFSDTRSTTMVAGGFTADLPGNNEGVQAFGF